MENYKDLSKEIFSAFCNSVDDKERIYFDTDNISRYEGVDEQITSSTFVNGADIELKCRRCRIYTYPTAMLQPDKYKKIMTYSRNKEKYYVNIYPYDNKIVWWNLTNTTIEDMEKFTDYKTTESYTDFNGAKTKHNDKKYELPFDWNCSIYSFDCSKWIQRINELKNKQNRVIKKN